jgi:hypothetical protein
VAVLRLQSLCDDEAHDFDMSKKRRRIINEIENWVGLVRLHR